ncbi:hypothetical protein [Arenimonas sp.]|uniref:hypothetical protein n=1 Tax=Arenimonas sp. TaxID=1872635 RepID=UPI0035B2A99D
MFAKISEFIFGGTRGFNDAETRLLTSVADSLPAQDRDVLRSQVNLTISSSRRLWRGLTQGARPLMIKLARDQKFWWLEPFAFARARRGRMPGMNTPALAIILSVLFGVPLFLVAFPDSSAELAVICLIAGISGLTTALTLPWITQLPNDVMIASDRIVLGRDVVPFDQISHALVGETMLAGRSFRVLSFTTKSGRSYLFGLSRKVDSKELEAFLRQAGVREPAA